MDQAEVSRRLKAARWLAGGIDANGKPVPLSARDLADRDPLRQNRISANRIEEIEQMRVPNGARDMELRTIAVALGLAEDYFATDSALQPANALRSLTDRLASLEELLREHDDRARQATENIRRIAAGQESREAILDLAADAVAATGEDPQEPGDEADEEQARSTRDQSNPEQGRQ